MCCFYIGTVLVRVSIAILKHRNRIYHGKRRVCFILQCAVQYLWKSGQELRELEADRRRVAEGFALHDFLTYFLIARRPPTQDGYHPQ